ncbi:MAG: hypothetical protein E7125_02560 [Bacteroidales bacterium]|jgi:hypothetical protein|nr:hypothetical protein [Bacteroidales bacterium]
MAFTETTRTSYGKRLGNSLGGVLMGIILFIGGTALIWWNEGRAVKTTKMLKEAQGKVVELTDLSAVDPSFEGKLVHAMGFANTTDSLYDSQFKAGVRGIALHRTADYYQWVEHSQSESEDKLGGAEETTTTYTYEREWVSDPVPSADFHDPAYRNKNTVKQNVEDLDLYAKEVSFGAYKLNNSQIRSISGEMPLPVDSTSNIVYIGANPAQPEVGDVRVTFTKVLPAEISIVATVSGNTFVPFMAKNGQSFTALRMGDVSQEEIFEDEHATNKMLLWVLRIVGFFLVFIGLRSLFGILETLLQVLPFLADIVGWGVGLVCGLVALVWTLLVAALAWVAYRPVVALVLVAIAAAAVFFVVRRQKKVAKTVKPAE